MSYYIDKCHTLIKKLLDEDQGHVLDAGDYQELQGTLNLHIGNQAATSEEIEQDIANFFFYTPATHSKRFFNQLFAGRNAPAILGELLAALSNTTMTTHEASPVATHIETYLIEKMGRLIGFKNTDGIFVSGGAQANLVALLCARQHQFPDSKYKGLTTRSVVLVSDQAHYSLLSAANTAGIGQDNVISIETDDSGRMKVDALQNALDILEEQNRQPLMICATTGTSVLGAFDPVDQIAAVAQRRGIWLHVDGCFGASGILTPKLKDRMRGSYLADSLCWDAHKLMGVPLSCSALLINDHRHLLQALSAPYHAEYMFHEEQGQDLGKKSLQCGRRADVLKLWFTWKAWGDSGYSKKIGHLYDLALYAADYVRAHPTLALITEPEFVIVCFRYVEQEITDLNEFNRKLREALFKKGIWINYSELKGQVVLRLPITNFSVEQSDIDFVFQQVIKTAKSLKKDAR